mmetsp:Transcript_25180/g.34700  ORF Transcript_25180/g.34700 Transcript_25180/m.34700 type:complete len:347 (-) Transcript_25180:162-1202(-)|eukprot:CAMPEP_0196571414 /NCGR_PEP_ID=MMETSP1081-20130531/1600_1 /TAXON_ID=36882 /ORGANISM="Pyramimonas amylifera, Strain CCMP720" /LENGTH=346 /DNA_ID=CAMNT_0041888357 /DNA_START=98 /DNA_END=1138 /DNA_ORIENTATION=-
MIVRDHRVLGVWKVRLLYACFTIFFHELIVSDGISTEHLSVTSIPNFIRPHTTLSSVVSNHHTKGKICIVSFLTQNLMEDWTTYGPASNKIKELYANKHGYSYKVYTEVMSPEGAPLTWNVPMAARNMFKDDPTCDYVFSMDGDAVFNNLNIKIESLIDSYMSPEVNILFTCHNVDGSMRSCGKCKCTKPVKPGTCSHLKSLKISERCGINMGVFIAKNNKKTREMIDWWCNAGNGKCSYSGGSPMEILWKVQPQVCSDILRERWLGETSVVNALVMNTPSFFDPKRFSAIRTKKGDANLDSKCFSSRSIFVCHTYGVHSKGGTLRAKMINDHWDRLRNNVTLLIP